MASKFIISALLLVTCFCCKGQEQHLLEKVENLEHIKKMPYLPELSGDSLYWTIIIEGLDIAPYLIDKLSDTTITDAAVHNFGGYYTVSDIAYAALTEIIHGIPTLELAENPREPEPRNGFWGYWNYTRKSYANRLLFKERVNYWYKTNKNKLVWNECSENLKSASDWKYDKNKHPAGGYYSLPKQIQQD